MLNLLLSIIAILLTASCATTSPPKVHILLGIGEACCVRVSNYDLRCENSEGMKFTIGRAANFIETDKTCGATK
jgi:hypothetical protein